MTGDDLLPDGDSGFDPGEDPPAPGDAPDDTDPDRDPDPDRDHDADPGTDDRDRVARARIRTAHADPATVAAALEPDNTAEMDTAVEDGRVRTTIERESAAGLRSTADDYLVNLDVAERTVAHARDHTTRP